MQFLKFWMLERKLKDQDSADRRQAVMELARSREGRAVELLTAQLCVKGEKRPGRAWEVAETLGETGGPVAVSVLLAALQPGPEHLFGGPLESAVVRALGKIGDPRAVTPLAARMMVWTHDERAYRVPEAEAEALRHLGWEPSTAEERAVYAVALGQYERAVAEGTAALRPLLAAAALLTEAAPLATEALVKLGSVAVEPLLKPLAEGRAFAAVALGQIGDARVVDPLTRALAASALIRYGAGSAESVVGGTPVDPRTDCGSAAIEALAALARRGAEQAAAALAAFVQDPASPGRLRQKAALALGELGPAGGLHTVEALIATLRDENVRVRADGARALGELGEAQAVEPLIAVLRDVWCGGAAAEALGRLGDLRAVEPLMEAVADRFGPGESENARFWRVSSTVDALGLLGDPRAVTVLVPLIGESREVYDRGRSDYSSEAVSALERILTRAAQDVPIEALQTMSALEDVVVLTWTEVDDDTREPHEEHSQSSCVELKRLAGQELVCRSVQP